MPPATDVQQVREHYLPNDVRVLFVGESPPAGPTFFYCANSKLCYATEEAFAKGVRVFRGVVDFLDAFMTAGCYLEDLALEPVNDRPRPARREACKAGIAPLAERIRPLNPRVVAIVSYGIADWVTEALETAGHGAVEREKLPFPTTRLRIADRVPYRDVYIDELSALVARWRRRHILAPL